MISEHFATFVVTANEKSLNLVPATNDEVCNGTRTSIESEHYIKMIYVKNSL